MTQVYDHQLSIGITTEMDRFLEELARSRTRQSKNGAISKAHLVREAIRLYMDQQADLHGSRKQIAKSLEGKMEQLTEQVVSLAQQVTVVNQQVYTERQEINAFHRAMQPLIQWVQTRSQSGRS